MGPVASVLRTPEQGSGKVTGLETRHRDQRTG